MEKHRWFRWKYVVLLSIIPALFNVPTWAQTAATLTGIVGDSTEAVVPGVAITLTHAGTGEVYTTTTNAVGSYTIPFVKPGTYNLTAESAGFKRYNRASIRLDTAANVAIDIVLELGEVTEVVTVEADVPLLKTTNASVNNVIRNKTIADMPLLGRRAAQLVRLSGFVVQNGTDSQFQIAGGRNNNAMWTLDGGSTQNILLGVATLTFDPPIEALEEMNVEVSNYKAEMGRTGGGFIQMTTKSGTNDFHGALYEFLRNDAMDSRQFFAAEKQKLRRNQFGWAFGGPIVKDRTFFFASQEFTRQKTADPRIENIPSPAELLGDFSDLSATIINPFSGETVPNNIIPMSEMDPVGLAVAQFWPEPNIPNQPSRNRNYLGLSNDDRPAQALTIRVDHTINDRNRIFGRYVHNLANREEGGGIWPQDVHNNHRLVDNTYVNASVTAISNITPMTVAEFRYTWNHRKFHPTMPAQGAGFAERLGIRGTNPEYFPGFAFTGGIQRIGRGGGQERRQFPIRDVHFITNWTHAKGNHTFKWGWEFRSSRNDDVNLGTAGGNFSFNNTVTRDPIAALLYGWVASGNRSETFLLRSRAQATGGYFQDDWKISPKFTINLGLRYDYDIPRWEDVDNRQNSFDEAAINPACDCPGILTWSGRSARGGSKYAHNFDANNFGPRVGFAYRPTDGWVIRGGGSIVFVGQYDQATPATVNAGFSVQGNFSGLTPSDQAFQLSAGLPPTIEPTEADLVPEFGAVAIGEAPTFAPQFFQPENRPVPYLITYNFNIQRQLPANMLFEIGYLATLGRKLTIPGTTTINQIHPSQIHFVDEGVPSQILRPFPQYSNVTLVSPTFGDSQYHGMNLRLEKRYSSGLQFNMNYTFAKAMDNVEGRDELGGEDDNVPFANQYDRSNAWSVGGSNVKHRYVTSVVYDLPWGKGRAKPFSSDILNQLAGGWTIGTIIEARTGPPFSTWWGNAGQIYPTAPRVRADAVAPYAKNGAWRDNVRGEDFFNADAFVRPERLTFGNVGRNAFTAPGALRADLSLLKEIYMPWEDHTLQFRGEVINFPNRANFGLPNGNRQAGSFGAVTGLIGGASGRIIQLGLRYAF